MTDPCHDEPSETTSVERLGVGKLLRLSKRLFVSHVGVKDSPIFNRNEITSGEVVYVDYRARVAGQLSLKLGTLCRVLQDYDSVKLVTPVTGELVGVEAYLVGEDYTELSPLELLATAVE